MWQQMTAGGMAPGVRATETAFLCNITRQLWRKRLQGQVDRAHKSVTRKEGSRGDTATESRGVLALDASQVTVKVHARGA